MAVQATFAGMRIRIDLEKGSAFVEKVKQGKTVDEYFNTAEAIGGLTSEVVEGYFLETSTDLTNV